MHVQRRPTKTVTGLEHPSCGDQLGELGWFWGDLITASQFLNGASRRAREGLFTWADRDRTRGVLKLKENRFRLDIRKQFFTVKVVRFWNSWTREVVEAPSMEMFKASLDRTLSNLV